jgi:hypothetical protein
LIIAYKFFKKWNFAQYFSWRNQMLNKFLKSLSIFFIFVIIFQVSDADSKLAKAIPFKILDLENVSRYNEDRINYQRIEKNVAENIDNSIETLLIIKDRKMYLLKDGYDDPKNVETNRKILEMENRMLTDLWTNKINNKPDFLQTTDRRIEVLKKIDEDYVDKNFGEYYRNVRNKFIMQHVNTFKGLMVNRKESKLNVVRSPIPKKIADPENSETKYYISVTAKTIDEKVYFAEDADGDGITETFSVTIPDGFSWGYESGPNILFIYNNNKDTSNKEKNKEIEDMIKDLTKMAYYGTAEEEKFIKENFPTEKTVNDMIDDIYKVIPPDMRKEVRP